MTFPVDIDTVRLPAGRKADAGRQAQGEAGSGQRFAEHMDARVDDARPREDAPGVPEPAARAEPAERREASGTGPAGAAADASAPSENAASETQPSEVRHARAHTDAPARTQKVQAQTAEAADETDAEPDEAAALVAVPVPAEPSAAPATPGQPETGGETAAIDGQGIATPVETAETAVQTASAAPALPGLHEAAAAPGGRMVTTSATADGGKAIRVESKTAGNAALRAEAAHAPGETGLADKVSADTVLQASGKDGLADLADQLHQKAGLHHDRIATPDGQSFLATLQAATDARPLQPTAPATPQLAPMREAAIVASPGDVGDVVARHLSSSDGPGKDRIVVQLDPPELGRVSIDFKFDGQTLQQVTVTSDNPEALRQMRQMQADLASILQRHGMSGENLSFRQGGQGSDQRWGGNRSGRSGASTPVGSTAAEPLIAASAPRLAPGRLNITL